MPRRVDTWGTQAQWTNVVNHHAFQTSVVDCINMFNDVNHRLFVLIIVKKHFRYQRSLIVHWAFRIVIKSVKVCTDTTKIRPKLHSGSSVYYLFRARTVLAYGTAITQ